MFSKVLFENLQANFTSFGSQTIQWGFGGFKEGDVVAPYIVFNELDDDRDKQYLCDSHGDSGDYFLQLNIYSPSFIINNAIKKAVSDYLLTLAGVELTDGTNTYIMNTIEHSSSPSANTLTNGLAVDVLAKTINYEKI